MQVDWTGYDWADRDIFSSDSIITHTHTHTRTHTELVQSLLHFLRISLLSSWFSFICFGVAIVEAVGTLQAMRAGLSRASRKTAKTDGEDSAGGGK